MPLDEKTMTNLMDATEAAEPSDDEIEEHLEGQGVEVGEETALAIEQATAEVCAAQDRSEKARRVADAAKEKASEAAAEAKEADGELRDAARRLRKLREGRFPDPEAFPLFDTNPEEGAD